MGKSSTEEEVRDRRGLYELISDPTIVYVARSERLRWTTSLAKNGGGMGGGTSLNLGLRSLASAMFTEAARIVRSHDDPSY
jgi:hypothetical protein